MGKQHIPVWGNLKTNNTSSLSLRIFMVHDSKAQVVVNEMSIIFALHNKQKNELTYEEIN